MLGYTVVEPGSVVATHVTEVVRKHADEILTRDATSHLIEEIKKNTPAVVTELIPGLMKLAEVQQVLQMLLRERVPIRQLGTILETLGDYAGRTKDPVLLTEYVRHRLARTLCTRYRDAENRLMFCGYDPRGYKLFIWVLSAVLCGLAGALYVPQVGIINPSEMSPTNSIEAAIWVALGGRGTLIGPLLGAGAGGARSADTD